MLCLSRGDLGYTLSGSAPLDRLTRPTITTFRGFNGRLLAISDLIRHLRQESHWSQGELGEQLGAHQKQVSACERGVTLPSTDVLI